MQTRLVTNAALFLATLWLARAQNWAPSDVAWSMWLSSLMIGYGFILVAIFVSDPFRASGRAQGDLSKLLAAKTPFSEPLADRIASLLAAAKWVMRIFLLGFFTLHFGMFHTGHAYFLQGFFPLEGFADGTGGEAFDRSVFDYFGAAFTHYWPFVIAAGAAQAPLFFGAWRGEAPIGLFAPYRAVIKNHLVILALGLLTALAPGADVLYFLLLTYFFPWDVIGAAIRKPKQSVTA